MTEQETQPQTSLAHRARMVLAVEVVPLVLAVWGVGWVGVSTLGIALCVAFYLMTMLGVELGMHRLIAHRAFRAPPVLRALLCVLGAMAGEGSPLLWSAIHRLHHKDPDGPDDPHSPLFGRTGFVARVSGFIWAQSLWYGEVPGLVRFQHARRGEATSTSPADVQARALWGLVADWQRDSVVIAVERAYPLCIVLGFVLPAAFGAIVGGVEGAWIGLVWGGFVRFVLVQKVSFAINTVTHTIGTKPFASRDNARNNVVMAVLTLGAGWHNNHHAFPGAASTWIDPWHVDACGALIRVLERLGVIDDVRRVSQDAVRARRV